MDKVLENALKEGPCSRTASINEISFSPSSTPPFSPRMASENDYDTFGARNLGHGTDCRSCSSSLTEGEYTDMDFDDEIEDDIDFNREDATHLILGDIQMFSPTQNLAQSMLRSSQLELRAPTSPQTQSSEPELSPRIQITHAGETGLKARHSVSHVRRISGYSDSSTLQGSVHEDEEFPMRKDANEDVIQVIEIPLKSPGRKRGSSLFGNIKKVVARN
jgi:hypothetical protein